MLHTSPPHVRPNGRPGNHRALQEIFQAFSMGRATVSLDELGEMYGAKRAVPHAAQLDPSTPATIG